MMKKSLIALAVLAASSAAMAQSSVTLYGIADLGVVKAKGESAMLSSGNVSGSRWGIKGTEDLGGGLSAMFNFEQGINLTNGANTGNGFGRQAWVGLGGGFGALKFGKVPTAYDDVAGASNPVFDSALASSNIAPSYSYTWNPNNGVYYSLPSMGGFGGAVSTTFKDTAASNLRVTAFNVNYGNGPVFAALSYQQEKSDVAATRKLVRLNGSYDLGAAKVLAAFGTDDSVDSKDFTIGADVPLGSAMTLSAGFTTVKFDNADTQNSFGIGLAYSLSKRTTAYTGFRKDNEAAGDTSLFAVGLKHTF